jgi:hypothetical protein
MIKGFKKLELISVYPNPTINDLSIRIGSSSTDKINLVVTDLAGKLIIQKNAQLIAGENNLLMNVAGLPSVNYFIKVVCEEGCNTTVSKFVKQ